MTAPEAGHYVVIGGPGQGKTTAAQFLCQLFRASLLQAQPTYSLHPDVLRALAVLERQRTAEGLTLPSARRFPVLIVLNELAQYLVDAPAAEASVVSFVAQQMSRRVKQDISADTLRRWLASYPWFLVFDGLDEVPASTNREELLAAVREFLLDARADNADILVLATSRPQGYGDEFSPEQYRHLWLTPLAPADALRYAARLVDVRYGLESDKGALLLKKLERATRQEATARLMETPLQVTIMAQLVDRLGQPPQERYSLFKDYYEVIYSRELEREIPAAEVLRHHRADVDSIHWRVGLALQTRSELAGGTEARLTRNEFAEVVEARLVEEEHEGEELVGLTARLTEAAAHRLVFLVGHESDAIGFEIRSLQEFMAAEAVHEGGEAQVQARLRAIAGAVHWRNVFLFAAGRCFTRNQSLRDTVVLTCQELNNAEDSNPVAAAVQQGSLLALDLLDEGSCRHQPKYLRQLWRLATGVLQLPRREDHVRLARVAQDLDRVEKLVSQLNEDAHRTPIGVLRAALILSSRGNREAAASVGAWLSEGLVEADQVLQELLTSGVATDFLRDRYNELLPYSRPRRIYATAAREMYQDDYWHGAPEWAPAVVRWMSGTSISRRVQTGRVALPTGRSPRLTLQLVRVGGSSDSDLAKLRDMPFSNPDWAPLVAAADFAANPDPRTLSAALARALEGPMPRFFSDAPWPLASLLRWPGGLDERIVAAARDGELGTSNDWLAAEDRWLREGLTLDDIRESFAVADAAPLTPEYSTRGFPLGTAAWSVSIGGRPGDITFLEELVAIRRGAAPCPARGGLARILFRVLGYVLRERPELARDFTSEYVDALIDAARHLQYSPVPQPGVLQILQPHLSEGERAVLYDYLGEQDVLSSHEAPSGLAPEVVDSWRQNPGMLGHAGLLVSLYRLDRFPAGTLRDIPLVDPVALDGQLAENCLLLRLIEDDITESLMQSVLSALLVSDRGPQLLITVSDILGTRGHEGMIAQEKLLLNTVSSGPPELNSRARLLLNALARRGRSGLAGDALRQRLGFDTLPGSLFTHGIALAPADGVDPDVSELMDSV